MLQKLPLTEEHALWLEKVRRLDPELSARLGVSSHHRNVAFDYLRNDVTMFRKVRVEQQIDDQRDKTFFIEPKGAELFLWGEDSLRDDYGPDVPLLISEGEFDRIALLMSGAAVAVSVPNGTVNKPGAGDVVIEDDRRFGYLWQNGRLNPLIDKFKRIIIASDADKAGGVLRDELALRLGRTRCWYVGYPDGCKDANDVLIRFGEQKGCDILQDMIAEARPIVPSRLVRFSEIPVRTHVPVSSGWRDLDANLRVMRPELMVIGGPPGHGKSQWSLALAANLAYTHGWPGAIIQFEDDVERNRNDLIRFYLGKTVVDREPADADRAAATAWVDKLFRTISPSEDVEDEIINLDWLHANVEEAATRHGCKWIIIDPWNEIEHLWSRGQTEASYLNSALRSLKRLARRYVTLLMLVVHPDKEHGRETDIDNWSLYSMAGGAVWNNKADHGIIVLRDEGSTDQSAFIKVAKSKRHATMGKPGIVRMRLRLSLGNYEFLGTVNR